MRAFPREEALAGCRARCARGAIAGQILIWPTNLRLSDRNANQLIFIAYRLRIHFMADSTMTPCRSIAALNLRSSLLTVRLVDIVGWAIFEMSSRSSYNPPGAISPATRHLTKIEFGHEILRGARRHFELPCYQAGG